MSTQALIDRSLEAADRSAVAVFAFRDGRGRPMAWPVTPYVDGDRIVVTSTLAYIRKAEHVRRDARVALLAAGVHTTGRATVRADVSGDEFVSRFLSQELRKYPPARALVRVPLHRRLFSWYFGRVLLEFAPLDIVERPGEDRCTLAVLDGGGFPSIVPIAEPASGAAAFAPVGPEPGGCVSLPNGPATLLVHEEPTMADLRQMVLRGEVTGGAFYVRSTIGSLAPPGRRGWLGDLRRQFELRRRARHSRAIVRAWRDQFG